MNYASLLDVEKAALEVLDPIVRDYYQGGAGDVLVDGGVRRGADVVKAIARGHGRY